MYKIENKKLEDIKRNYLQEDLCTVARHAMSRSNIQSITKVNEQSENLTNYFSINLKTLLVANQKQSGRCWIFAGCNVLREKVAKKI